MSGPNESAPPTPKAMANTASRPIHGQPPERGRTVARMAGSTDRLNWHLPLHQPSRALGHEVRHLRVSRGGRLLRRLVLDAGTHPGVGRQAQLPCKLGDGGVGVTAQQPERIAKEEHEAEST